MKYNLANNEPFEINGDVYVKGKALDDLTSIPFTNPVGEWCPDPCFWKGDDGYFYIKGTGRLTTVKRTRDFVNYEDTGRIFISTEAQNKLFDLYGHYATDDSTYKLHPNYWAPFVIKIGDNWVLYQAIIERTGTKTNVVDGTAHIVAFTSKTPYGDFSNPVTIVSDNEINAAYNSSTKWNNIIDPFVYCDPFDNHIYLLAGSSYAIRRKRLSDDGLSMYKDGSTLAVDNYAMHVAGQSIKTDPSRATVYEGAYLYNKIGKWGNYWYLFVSSGSYDNRDYCVKVGRYPSTNYHIGGTTNINFLDKGNNIMRIGGGTTILSTESDTSTFWGPGHIGGIFETEDGKTWMLYHCHDGNGTQDRKLFIQELLWDENGWPYFENNGHPISNGRISRHIITSTNDVERKKDITEITCSDLVNLINNSNLIPGMKYRITDYNCTTTQTDTMSAGHQFDIIVEALDEKTLSENASAIQHAGDTYFAGSDLKSWELKYSFKKNYYVYEGESDTGNLWDSRTYNFSNESNAFKYNGTFEYNGDTYYMWRCSGDSQIAVLTEYNDFFNNNLHDYVNYFNNYYDAFSATPKIVAFLKNDVEYTTGHNADLTYIVNYNGDTDKIYVDHFYLEPYVTTLGQIYYMKDEFNNECPYDFKNIKFKRYKITSSTASTSLVGQYATDNAKGVTVDKSIVYWCYTFSTYSLNDASLDGYSNSVYENIIPEYIIDHQQILNDIVFIGPNNCRNRFGVNCHSNTFGNNCHSNTFGNSCYKNTFGNNCHSNTFGNDCYYSTFGNNCYFNTFGNSCYSNTFGNNCSSNTFGNNCFSNTFGNSCYSNTFGNNCFSNTFGNTCSSNTFGNNCEFNIFRDYIRESQFGDGVQYFSIATASMTSGTPSSSNLKSYISWLIVENGVIYANPYVTGTTSSSSYCQNVRICQGCSGTSNSNRKSFQIDNINKSKQLIVSCNSSGTIKSGNLGDLFK